MLLPCPLLCPVVQVHGGMPVRPRGLGTPRRDMLAGEVYRSSLDAPCRGFKRRQGFGPKSW